MDILVKNKKGQGVVEYVLVLTLVVIATIGILARFNKAAGDFIRNYYGDYISCLLETGELPSLGNEARVVGICDTEFQAFTFSSGRPPVSSNTNGTRSNRSSSNRDRATNIKNSPSSARDRNQEARDRQNSEAAGAARDRSDRVINKSGGGGSRFQGNLRPKTVPASNSQASQLDSSLSGNDKEIASGNINGRQASFNGKGPSGGRVQYVGLGKEDREVVRLSSKKSRVPATDAAIKSELQNVPYKEAGKSASATTNINLDLSFGDYIRYFLILAIILTLLFLIASQVRQAMKSMEK